MISLDFETLDAMKYKDIVEATGNVAGPWCFISFQVPFYRGPPGRLISEIREKLPTHLLVTRHLETVYVILKGAPPCPYKIQAKTKAFYALVRLVKRGAYASFYEWASLCQYCRFFYQGQKDPHLWKSWWKPWVICLQYKLGYLKWVGRVVRRKLPRAPGIPNPTGKRLGVCYHPWPQATIVTQEKSPTPYWTMLYVDENHWKTYGLEYYVSKSVSQKKHSPENHSPENHSLKKHSPKKHYPKNLSPENRFLSEKSPEILFTKENRPHSRERRALLTQIISLPSLSRQHERILDDLRKIKFLLR